MCLLCCHTFGAGRYDMPRAVPSAVMVATIAGTRGAGCAKGECYMAAQVLICIDITSLCLLPTRSSGLEVVTVWCRPAADMSAKAWRDEMNCSKRVGYV
eukprot:9336262-Alexandrium_andersonii.AAC.1